MRGTYKVTGGLMSLVLGGFLWVGQVSADRFTSPSYTIDASSAGHSVGGAQSSTNYQLISAGGESVIGNGSGGSYVLGEGYVAQLDKSLQLTVQPNGLKLYFPFDESVGPSTFDASANSAVGTLANTPTRTTGKIGGALDFDATTEYVSTASTADLKPTTTLTIETWVKPVADGSLVSNAESGGYGLELVGASPGVCAVQTVCFRFWSGGAYRSASAPRTFVTNGAWNHIAVTYDGSVARIYINGVEQGSTSYSGTITYHATAPFCVGRKSGPTDCTGPSPFDGDIDEVKFFSRTLSPTEIKAEYDAGVAGYPAGLGLAVSPSASSTSSFDTVTQTDAPGYSLAINQNQNLTSGGNTIPAVSGTIASPVTWSEGATLGLGFTLYGTNATAIPGKWGSGAAYAALPGSATSFYTRTGYTAGAKDYLNMRLRIGVSSTQAPGEYTNLMTVTGTMTP